MKNKIKVNDSYYNKENIVFNYKMLIFGKVHLNIKRKDHKLYC